ncbi:hypothetical protein EBR21_02850, partial [bacterium]|nr:hypothetical protein [bacterium]
MEWQPATDFSFPENSKKFKLEPRLTQLWLSLLRPQVSPFSVLRRRVTMLKKIFSIVALAFTTVALAGDVSNPWENI